MLIPLLAYKAKKSSISMQWTLRLTAVISTFTQAMTGSRQMLFGAMGKDFTSMEKTWGTVMGAEYNQSRRSGGVRTATTGGYWVKNAKMKNAQLTIGAMESEIES